MDVEIVGVKPLGYSSDGKKVLLRVDGGKLFWYDLESEQVMICVGSLVPPSFPVDNCTEENHTKEGTY